MTQDTSGLLITARCHLRPAVHEDRSALLAVAQSNDPKRMDQLLTNSAHWWAVHHYGVWMVTDQAVREAIGWCALRPGNSPMNPELFYGLAPAAQGRGLMTEAASAVLGYTWGLPGIESVWSATRVNHQKSVAVMERIGLLFERQGDLDGVESLVYRAFRPGVESDQS